MASGSVTQAQSPLSYKDVSLLVVSGVQKMEKVKKEIFLQNVLNVSENFGPDSDCVYSLFLPSGQGRESDSLDFIYVQPESAEIFVSNLLNLSRANLNKSAALNMQCLYY